MLFPNHIQNTKSGKIDLTPSLLGQKSQDILSQTPCGRDDRP